MVAIAVWLSEESSFGDSARAHGRPTPRPYFYCPAGELDVKQHILPVVAIAYSILAVSVAAVLKGRVGRQPDPQRRATLLIAGWAVGEGAALIGVIIFYITGQAQWYGLGLLAMVSAFAMLSPGAALPTAE